MKICFITTMPITQESFILPTAIRIHEEFGAEVYLACNDSQEFKKKLPEFINFYPIKMKRGVGFDGVKVISRLTKFFKREKFDFIQYSTPNASLYSSIAGKLAKIKIRRYAQWGIRYVGLSGLKRKIFKLIEKITCKNSTEIRAVSQKNLEFALNEKLYKPNKVKVVGNGGTIGVDLNDFNILNKQAWREQIRDEYNLKNEDFVFGFVGRLTRDKGANELLSAFKQVQEENKNAKLLIVGSVEGSEEIDKNTLEWAKNSTDVVFVGMVENSQTKLYYSALNVLVHPTYREGFGLVLQEAGGLGVTMITTDIPGAGEVMEDGKSCLLVKARDPLSLKKAMERLIGDKNLTLELSQNAYNRTKTLYSRDVMLENQMEDYRETFSRLK